MGVCLRFLTEERPHWRYLADASYWVYIVHDPILYTLQALVARLPGPVLGKYAFFVSVTFAVSLWTYQKFVRGGWLGGWLNGQRRPPFQTQGPGNVPAGMPVAVPVTASVAHPTERP